LWFFNSTAPLCHSISLYIDAIYTVLEYEKIDDMDSKSSSALKKAVSAEMNPVELLELTLFYRYLRRTTLSQSNLNFQPLTSHFGAQVTGLNIEQGIDEPTLKILAQALIEHKVLVIRDQELSTEQYAKFGRIWTDTTRVDSFTEMHVPGFDDINIIGNVGEIFKDAGYRNGAAFWHTDCAAEPDPNAITMLYCIHALEKEGETVFADMAAAYQGLDPQTRQQIEGLEAWHCYAGAKPVLGGREPWEYALTPVTDETSSNFPDPVKRPIIRKHSLSGIPCLYAPAGSAFAIEGMDHDDAFNLMLKLKHHATSEQFCYQHSYQPGDLVMWDNTSTLHLAKSTHAATGDHDRRLMHRISPLGLPSVLVD
jgi:taurine dioxygenase